MKKLNWQLSARGVSTSNAARSFLICIIALFCLASPGASQQRKRAARPAKKPVVKPAAPVAPDTQAALERISADSLRGHLSFIASDLLAGRNTPSPGLEIAAEYIAAQFRRAGVEPGGEKDAAGEPSYFQTANWSVTAPDLAAYELTLNDGAQTFSVAANSVSYANTQPAEVRAAPIIKLDFNGVQALNELKPEQLAGKVILTEMLDLRRAPRETRRSMSGAQNSFVTRLQEFKPALIVSIDRHSQPGRGLGGGQLLDPERGNALMRGAPAEQYLTLHDARAIKFFDAMGVGETRGALTLKLAAPVAQPIKLRNVVSLLRGSDPVLKDTYVLVSAHYDHVGTQPGMEGDNIFNGANDDGSGTVSVIELAASLATLKTRPKRSIVFICWFGEERGLLGSRYYGKHPLYPLAQTVAMVNLEQVGRTDSSEGSQVNRASLTGFDFTDLGPIFKAAGEQTGITVYKHEQNSDAFFGRSDNQALADAGVPAHTLCVAFIYPDYHAPGDHWEKIDYANMARTNKMIALALITIAENATAPKWNEANPKTARYVQAWRALQGQ
jgi:hypothetical protein